MDKEFADTSIFQGWKQWHDDNGQEWRAERKSPQWHIFKKLDGDTAFVRYLAVRLPKSASCRDITDQVRSIDAQ